MKLDSEQIAKLECRITPENFESVAKALETAFPFLLPFRNVLGCCVLYVLGETDKVTPSRLETVISNWQAATSEQMRGLFSIPISSLFPGVVGSGASGNTVDFEPHRGDPATLCKICVFDLKVEDAMQPWVRIEFPSTTTVKSRQIAAFASMVETSELTVGYVGGESSVVTPGELC